MRPFIRDHQLARLVPLAAVLAGPLPAAHAADILIADGSAHTIVRFGDDGLFKGTFAAGGLAGRNAFAYGPDRRLYVADAASSAVLRYNAVTGEYLGPFVTTGSGGLSDPRGLTFGPDGLLYVTGQSSNAKVVRFDGATGAFDKVFELAPPFPRDITFGPDGNLYVICEICQDVIRFNAITGVSMGRFVDTGPTGPIKPYAMEFGPDGNFYITSSGADDCIRRYDGVTGLFIDRFATSPPGGPAMDDPVDLKFSADGSVLYVACQASNNVLAFDGATGAFLSEIAGPGEAGLGQVWALAIMPCFADHDHTGFVDTNDYDAFIFDFEAGSDAADFDQSGFVDTDDFDAFVHAFEQGC